ncbi:hypothetical protein IX51_06980 [uncultured archaeon]|nr:hypothetical protein IX51_06980 [uncultured archaeon]
MSMPDREEEDYTSDYCEITDSTIPRSHIFFRYDAEMKLALASLGLAVSQGERIQATREILDMLDTLYNNMIDPDSALPDRQRKNLNHADSVWLDLKEKLSQGSSRTAHLFAAHSHMQLALSYLIGLKNEKEFSEHISDYLIKYLGKLSVFTYREAIGHVML